jgi:hypothetical protein
MATAAAVAAGVAEVAAVEAVVAVAVVVAVVAAVLAAVHRGTPARMSSNLCPGTRTSSPRRNCWCMTLQESSATTM